MAGAVKPFDVALFDDVEALARDAGGALDRSARPQLYDRIDWLRLTARHVMPEARLAAGRARGDGGAAWLFLADEGGGEAGPFARWYTLAFRPVIDGPGGAAALAALARALRRRFHRVALHPLPADTADEAARAFRAGGWIARATPATVNWIADTEGLDFPTYWGRRPARLRNTLARRRARAPLALSILDRFDAEAWAAYEQVYAQSWKPEEGAPPFLRALAEQEGAAGTLRLGIARHEGRPVAAQLWLVENGAATIHKLAYAEDAKPLSPGTQLGAAMFAHVIEHDRPRTIDYGTGNDAYKADWMDRADPLYRLDLYNPLSPRGAAAAARAGAAALVRRLRAG